MFYWFIDLINDVNISLIPPLLNTNGQIGINQFTLKTKI